MASAIFSGVLCMCLAQAILADWNEEQCTTDTLCKDTGHLSDAVKHLEHEMGELKMAMEALASEDHCGECDHGEECHGEECHHEDECSSHKVSDGIHLEKYGSNYYYFAPKTMLYTREEAHDYCQAIGLDMISLETKEEYDILTAAMIKKGWVSSSRTEYYDSWTSAKKSSDGKLHWGSNGQEVSYAQWYPRFTGKSGECLGVGVYRNRAHSSVPSNRALVWDVGCYNQWRAICEYNHPECLH